MSAWAALYKSRWPGLQPVDWLAKQGVGSYESASDWRQLYWETHLQDCLDAAAGIALLPSIDGCPGELHIPDLERIRRKPTISSLEALGKDGLVMERCQSDALVRNIGYEGHHSNAECDYSKLSGHCQEFGIYASFLWTISQVEGLCKLLIQNSKTLVSLDFVHCKLTPGFLNSICNSLQMHGIQHFSIKMSSLLETCSVSLPVGLEYFLSSGRSLTSLSFGYNHLCHNFAKMVFNTLLNASSSIEILDLSENNIAGWLSHFKWRPSSLIGKSLRSLRVLNLRSNDLCKDDADCLKYALVHMPSLDSLDLSDNPIEDDGIKSLIPYFAEVSKRQTPFIDLKLENCELSCLGVSQLLGVLATLKKPLNTLSIRDNKLGSKVGRHLGKFLCTGIRALNVEGIGLGSSGFLEAQQEIMEELNLVSINISKNRGGIETAHFLSKLIARAPDLISVNAGYNFMPVESVSVICSCLRVAEGKLEHLDLTGNISLHQPGQVSLLTEFQRNGGPIVTLQLLPIDAPYDDDP
ncbi:hypothetical protein RJ640_026637 [Escallonia rubra]|uniref:Uncharacterized protein n=1 Tax=Escallonia rubra TaxID=112253 RepID=A0AA88RBQ4_9ASTE|nr:hypothetical protein RJ640_026637 [Escallonia rubra]